MKTSPILYILLGIVVVTTCYVLLSGRRKSTFRWGRKKKIAKILKEHTSLKATQRRATYEIIRKISPLFEKRGEIDYGSMVDELEKIVIKNQNYKTVVEILVNGIKRSHPFFHVSATTQALFEKIYVDLTKAKIDDAKEDLNILYKKCHEVEDSLRKRGHVEFLIGAGLSLLGVLYSFVSDLI